MMKVVRFTQFGGPEVLEIVDLPDPHPGPGQVRIAVRAAGVDASRLVAEFPEAAALPAAIETATRALDQGGDAGRAVHVLAEIGELIESGRFSLPVAQTFPLAEIAEAHRVSEHGHVRGKLVLVVGSRT
jgi:NADPH:quinone reductase-like Zn-dependent oxidoreductase